MQNVSALRRLQGARRKRSSELIFWWMYVQRWLPCSFSLEQSSYVDHVRKNDFHSIPGCKKERGGGGGRGRRRKSMPTNKYQYVSLHLPALVAKFLEMKAYTYSAFSGLWPSYSHRHEQTLLLGLRNKISRQDLISAFWFQPAVNYYEQVINPWKMGFIMEKLIDS